MIAKLVEYSPYSPKIQVGAVAMVLVFLVLTVFGYLTEGIKNVTDNLFRERNFKTTWYMYLLIAGEIGGLSIILWGFVQTQLIGG